MDILRDVRLFAPVNWDWGCRERGVDLDAGISGGSGKGMRYGDMVLLQSNEWWDREKSHEVLVSDYKHNTSKLNQWS